MDFVQMRNKAEMDLIYEDYPFLQRLSRPDVSSLLIGYMMDNNKTMYDVCSKLMSLMKRNVIV